MPAFEWVHVQLHQQKGMISLSPPTICNSAGCSKRLWFPPVLWGGNGQNSRPIRWAGAILYPEFVPFLPASPVGHFRNGRGSAVAFPFSNQ
ncbi:hypothetical protein A9819_25915 [Escherichia coli]|nr:hypothetical protein A9819_25915 [Escherichia coli]PBU60361.1 hypothetical protein BB553_29275 [Escherichia coli]PBU68422.1 hypothetical protein BB540_15385 [Escherichia coli]